MNKKVFLVVSFLLLILALIFGFFIFKSKKTFLSESEKVSNISDKKENFSSRRDKVICQKDWDKYENDVLGLGFCYPHEWGEVLIEPIKNLTLLEGAVEEYSKDEHNAYSNSIFIKFKNLESKAYENRNNIELHLFNDKYGGEYYPNAQAYNKGYIDNISALKNSKDICAYRTNFTELWSGQGRITEFWDECKKGVKTRILNHEEYFDKNLYSFELESLAYLNLENGSFDDLLIKRKYLYISQVEKRIGGFEDVFEAKNYSSNVDNSKVISLEEYDRQKSEFAEFVKNIYSYKPIIQEKEDFKILEGEDEKITIIRKYYWLLENNKSEEAYRMHFRNNSSADDFKSLYGKVFRIEAKDFEKTDDNMYKFFIDYQNHNKEKELYRIMMRVSDDFRIEIISTEKIVSEMVKFNDGNYVAYAKEQNGKNFVILERYGAEFVVDSGEAKYNEKNSNIGEVKFFGDIKFSPHGNYLIYKMFGWEWMIAYVYDIQNDKKVFEFNAPEKFDFSKDENYFFVCSKDGMAGKASGNIYKVSNFDKQFEIFDSKNDIYIEDMDCSYDESRNEVSFVYKEGCEYDGDIKNECKKNEIIYSLDQNKMVGKNTSDN